MPEPLRLVPPLAVEVNEDVVRKLETALVKAKAGEFAGIAIVAIARDGSNWTSFSKAEDTLKLIGGLAFVQYRQMRSYDESDE